MPYRWALMAFGNGLNIEQQFNIETQHTCVFAGSLRICGKTNALPCISLSED
jgi:hypothetical protein